MRRIGDDVLEAVIGYAAHQRRALAELQAESADYRRRLAARELACANCGSGVLFFNSEIFGL